jgi:hypothetical protein
MYCIAVCRKASFVWTAFCHKLSKWTASERADGPVALSLAQPTATVVATRSKVARMAAKLMTGPYPGNAEQRGRLVKPGRAR